MESFKKLNEKQKEAVDFFEGPALVLAGAGSGKTRVVTYRIVHLINMGVSPQSILGLTFTNKAAGEMKERVSGMTNSHVLVCTFHSLGARILRESIHHLGYSNNFTIYDEEDTDKLLKACLQELAPDEKKPDIKPFKAMISYAKNNLLASDSLPAGKSKKIDEELYAKAYASYQAKLREYNGLDFDDLIYIPNLLFREHPHVLEMYQRRWPFLLIDEYQDTNQAQYKLVKFLVEKSNNLFAVGDPDQSIYSWRGANINNILNFESDFPGAKTIRLEQNYRSRTNILEIANSLISHNYNRLEKNLWSDLGSGEKAKVLQAYSEKEEAEFVADRIRFYHETKQVPLNEIVVFYRTNAQSRVFEDQFLMRKIPYVIVGGVSFYQRKEVKDILAFLRMVQSGSDFISFLRTVNLPKRGIGEATIEKIRLGASQANMSLFPFLESLLEGESSEKQFRPSAKQKEALVEYVSLIRELKQIAEACSLKVLVKEAIEKSGYMQYLKEDPESYDDRKGNLDALISKAAEWEASSPQPTLSNFLEELSLRSNLDEADSKKARVSVMTIHNGKGLEFTLTFLVGLEENLCPHINSMNDKMALEEERRLCYVAITRAKEYLFLSYCRMRMLWGIIREQEPSRFLREIPEKLLEKVYLRKSYSESYDRRSRHREEQNVYDEPFGDEIKTVPLQPKPSLQEFKAGDTVYHSEFGQGTINTAYQNGSFGLTYKIFFTKGNRERTIVAKYAQLTKL